MKPPKIIYFVTVDWFFCSHFLERAVAAKNAGYDVVVLTRVNRHAAEIEAAGLRLFPLDIDRRSLNPFAGLRTLLNVCSIYRTERPQIVHHVALKPILIGGLAAELCRLRGVVNAVVGGGFIFTSKTLLTRLLRPIIGRALKSLLNPRRSFVVFENPDDLAAFIEQGYAKAGNAVLIRGAGVNPAAYSRGAVEQPEPIIILPARLLWDKGIGEFVEAARTLKAEGMTARFVVVGRADEGNRAAIDDVTLANWREDGAVEFWGFRDDMPAVLAQSSIACLPSYREGLPKALLDAMASGLPCVTTDTPGCREAVKHGVNGLLVPPRDAKALADALRTLILDVELRTRYGAAGRARLEAEFSSATIIGQTLDLYQRCIA